MIHFAIILLSIVPRPVAISDSVDVLEVHHLYDQDGRLVFGQLIGWDQNENVRFWRLIKTESLIPQRRPSGGYVVTFMDGDDLRIVHAPAFRERWTQNDVETENREILPVAHRIPLRVGGK